MQIGDKVWIFDGNHRIYKDVEGNETRSPWYRGHFVERYIVGETKQSWIVGLKGREPNHRSNIKVKKSTLSYPADYGLDGHLYLSEDEIDQKCWKNENHYALGERVRRCYDYQKLKEIEEILNRE